MTIEPGAKERDCLRRLLELARAEDLGAGDATGAILPAGVEAVGNFAARQGLVLCGGAFLAQIAEAYDEQIATTLHAGDGDSLAAGDVLACWQGPAAGVLAAERVALNFLQHLSAISTVTRAYVDAVAGTAAAIYDTRKTTPGWRELEKYAVRAGAGRNHRMGLYDAVLIKDNHLAVLARPGRADPLAGALADGLRRLEARRKELAFVELEVDTPAQLAEALKLPVDIILLDNMTGDELRRAVAMRDEAGLAGRVELEASGGVTLEDVRQVAETGVERIAVGALTHSAGAVDIGLDVQVK